MKITGPAFAPAWWLANRVLDVAFVAWDAWDKWATKREENKR